MGITINPSKMGGTGKPVTIPSASTDDEIRQAARDLARQLMDQNNGDQKQSLMDASVLLKQQPDILATFAPILVLDHFIDLIREVAKNEGKRIVRGLSNGENHHPGFEIPDATHDEAKEEWTAPHNLGAGMAARQHNDTTIFDWQIPHAAKKIGLAVRGDIGQVITHYATSISRDNNIKSMLEDVLKRMAKAPVDKPVREVIDPRELERLFRRHGVS